MKICQEKVHRYFIYNSKHSRIRVMNPGRRKIILRSNMIRKLRPGSSDEEDSLNQFCIDDFLGNIWFTYLHDENIYVYSYLTRKIIKIIKAYNPKLRELSNFSFKPILFLDKGNIFKINLTLQPNYGYAVSHFSINVKDQNPINVFSLYMCDRFKKGEESITKIDKQIFRSKNKKKIKF